MLDTVDDGHLPPPDRHDSEGADLDGFNEHDIDHLRIFYRLAMAHYRERPGGLFRVVYGFAVLADPENKVIDPDKAHIDFHPRIQQAERDAADLARLRRLIGEWVRDLTDDARDGTSMNHVVDEMRREAAGGEG